MDPYEVLGVLPTTGDEGVKRAYRELSRKYHPDSYVNNPLAGLAEEKFKEVQEAYDKIMKEREEYGQYGKYGAASSFTPGSEEEREVQLQAARNYIDAGHYKEALHVLNSISVRSAKWFYYSAIANYEIGNNIVAMHQAQEAVKMEPENWEYAKLLNRMKWYRESYENTSYNYGRPTFGTGNLCCDLWCADAMCECMGGDLCTCI